VRSLWALQLSCELWRMLQAVKAAAIVPVAAGRSNESQGLRKWYPRTRGTSFYSKRLFVAQRDHGIHVGSAARGEIARSKSHDHDHHGSHRDSFAAVYVEKLEACAQKERQR
jgi:hypothetical protein